MISEAIDRILELAETKIITVDGLSYVAHRGNVSPLLPMIAPPIRVHTLSAFVDYLKEDPDGLIGSGLRISPITKLMVHIIGPTSVQAISTIPATGHPQRVTYIYAVVNENQGPKFISEYHDPESFCLNLQTHFVPDDETAKVLRFVGNIQDGTVQTYVDDGVSQQVTVKTGVAKVETAIFPNPVILRPYRTFPELIQPSSKFILRLRSGMDYPGSKQNDVRKSHPTVGLFEIQDLFWKNVANETIAQELSNLGLPTSIPVLR